MLLARVIACVAGAGAIVLLGACQSVGPIAIDAGRDRYNSIIQSTSKQQAFANIVRVHYNEPTSFMEVTEVDATQTLSTTLGGGVTGIGSKPGAFATLGSISPGVTYSEAPLIRYVPLIGQGLVEQTVAPINTDALASLYDSGWSVMPLLDLATAFLTLDRDELGAAINLIAELDYNERLALTSIKSDWTAPKGAASDSTGSGSQSNKKTPTSTSLNDALVVNFLVRPHGRGRSADKDRDDLVLWNRLYHLYEGTQCAASTRVATNAVLPQRSGGGAIANPSPPRGRTQSSNLQNCINGGRNAIELRTLQVTKASSFKSAAPLMRTYSALGILKNAAQPPYPRIGFVNAEEYHTIAGYPWNDGNADPKLSVYTLRPEDRRNEVTDVSHASRRQRQSEDNRDSKYFGMIERWLAHPPTNPIQYVYFSPGLSDIDFVELNDRLWRLRRYMLIIQSDTPPPPNAYVSYFDRGLWHYIDGDDTISQKNFNLISLFMTVMASPPTSAPLSTSITIGGGG